MKRYEYKLYDRSGNFKSVLTSLVTSQVRFSSQINGGQGEISIDMNVNFGYTGVIRTDIVKIWCFSEKFPSGILIYSGFVSKIQRRYSRSRTLLSLRVLGIASLLTRTNVNASYATDHATILGNILSAHNASRGGIDITAGTLELTGSTFTTTFSGTTSLEAMRQVAEASLKWFYIGPDITLNFIGSSTTHRIAVDGEIESIDVEEDLETIINSATVKYTGGSTTRTNAGSIALFDLLSRSIDREEITNISSAQQLADSIVAEFGNPKPKISLIINDNFEGGIESLTPGMFVNILNSELPFDNCQIQKIEYTTHSVKLDLTAYNSFTKELLG